MREFDKFGTKINMSITKRDWVGLTDEEISAVLGSDIHDEYSGELRFIRLIEQALKDKNT